VIAPILRFLFSKPRGVVILGVLIINAGWILFAASNVKVPELAQLSKVSGVLDNAVKIQATPDTTSKSSLRTAPWSN